MTEPEIPTAKDLLPMISRLQSRVKELEEAENDRRFRECSTIIDNAKPAQAAASSLLDRVAFVIGQDDDSYSWHLEARCAIREVAAWLRSQGTNGSGWAIRLEQELERSITLPH